MVSIKMALQTIIINLKITSLGKSLNDKLKVLICLSYNQFRNSITGRLFPHIVNALHPKINKLADGIMLKFDGMLVKTIDLESIGTFTPFDEPWIWDYFKPKKGDVFIDIGAHLGKYSLIAAKIVGKLGKVIAIEANPENYRRLLENVKINSLTDIITTFNVAAYDKKTKVSLYIGDASGEHSIIFNVGKKWYNIDAIPVDHVVKHLKLKKVDWIKIDVEGAEYEVLQGLKNTLRRFRPKLIVEIHRKKREVLNFMSKLGYRYEVINPEGDYYFFWWEGHKT